MIDNRNPRRIIYDGLNLALNQGTGITTYTRMLASIATNMNYDVGVVYSTPFSPIKDPLLQDVLFFDQLRMPKPVRRRSRLSRMFDNFVDQMRCQFTIRPRPASLGLTVVTDQFAEMLPRANRAFVAKNLFDNAVTSFQWTGRSSALLFDPLPDIFHCTYPMPLRARSSCNIYTIHDVAPLKLPFATLDDKRQMYRILKWVADKADHIITVSETSRRDIVTLLGVEESRVTNTYQAVAIPPQYLERPESAIANYLDNLYGLELNGYLLFFGALEPKKNVSRLIDAYLISGVNIPLVIISGGGWQNSGELHRINEMEKHASEAGRTPMVRRLDYVDRSTLISFIRGARGVVFPSLYEGFGLPVLEAMLLGTPVITSAKGGLSEVSGEAAIVIDPYDIEDIAAGLRTIVSDSDLRLELSRRGITQATRFSLEHYQDRMKSLYDSLA